MEHSEYNGDKFSKEIGFCSGRCKESLSNLNGRCFPEIASEIKISGLILKVGCELWFIISVAEVGSFGAERYLNFDEDHKESEF